MGAAGHAGFACVPRAQREAGGTWVAETRGRVLQGSCRRVWGHCTEPICGFRWTSGSCASWGPRFQGCINDGPWVGVQGTYRRAKQSICDSRCPRRTGKSSCGGFGAGGMGTHRNALCWCWWCWRCCWICVHAQHPCTMAKVDAAGGLDAGWRRWCKRRCVSAGRCRAAP